MPRIAANLDLCEGYANCLAAAPDLFDIDDDGLVLVLRDEILDTDRAQVDEAVRSCPVSALSVVGE